MGRVLTESQNGQTITYIYDAMHKIWQYNPSGDRIRFQYNQEGQVSQVLLNGNLVANNSYNEINQLTNRSFGNTIQLTQEFNANGALMSIHAKKNKQERMHLTYTYDSLNRKTSETDMLNNQNSESYQYDNANRLVNWSRANTKQQSWQLDALANWLSTTANGVTETRQHNNTNAIVSSQTNNQNVNITYDLDGNTSFDGKFYYSSDALNRIISVRDLNQNLVANYQLDAINRRISKTVENTITTTVYAGWQVAEENEAMDGESLASLLARRASTGCAQQQEVLVQRKNTKLTLRVYVYGNYIDEALVMKHTKPNGNVKQYWYLHNQQYSVYALLNDSGAIVEKYHYSAYGESQIETTTGAVIDTSAYDNHYLYTGRLLDQETELFYFRNRYYHSSQGRFISRDPLGYVDGMSLYRGYFVVNGVDWSGKSEVLPNAVRVFPCTIKIFLGHGSKDPKKNKALPGQILNSKCSAASVRGCYTDLIEVQTPIPGAPSHPGGSITVSEMLDLAEQDLKAARLYAPELCKKGCCKKIDIIIDKSGIGNRVMQHLIASGLVDREVIECH